MKYICAQPATQYFGWQIDAMLYSFVATGVNLEDVHVVSAIDNGIDPYFNKLMEKYPGVIFSFYEDTRDYKGYIASIKQHLLYKHFTAFPYLETQAIFLIDCDVALTRPLNLDHLLLDDVWYVSDTISYIGYDYIKSKGEDILECMLKSADISEDIVKSNQGGSGGAQYLYKNVKASFWKEVVDMSHSIYINTVEASRKKKLEDSTYHEIQIWTAEMWAMVWVAWKKGIMTCVSKDLDFCWATDLEHRWKECAIFHNAGVTIQNPDLFLKSAHIQKLPTDDLKVDERFCSSKYYNLVKSAVLAKQ